MLFSPGTYLAAYFPLLLGSGSFRLVWVGRGGCLCGVRCFVCSFCLFGFSLLNEKGFVEQGPERSFPPLPCLFVMRSTAVSSPLNINDSHCNFSLMCFILVPVQAVEMKTPLGPYVECNLLCSFGCKHDNKLEDVMNIHRSAQGFLLHPCVPIGLSPRCTW